MPRIPQRKGFIRRGGGVSPARVCAHHVVSRVFDEGAYAHRALRAEADRAQLEPRDRALAQRLAYGTVQRRATLDHLVGSLSSRPLDDIDRPLLHALRLGLFQLFFLDAVPDHAAVEQTVELAKGGRRGGHRFANALLRRATQEGPALLDALDDDSPAGAAVLHSHPEWVVRLWWDHLGPAETRALLAVDNEAPERALRVNELLATPAEVSEALDREGICHHTEPEPPEALVCDTPFDAIGSELFERGAIMPQSRASMMVSKLLDPKPGERVLDMCAAPGAKTSHIAALMQGRGELVALERHAGRAAELQRNCRRLGADWVRTTQADAADPPPAAPFDRVLLDVPCSGLGTLRSRPDARWRRSPDQIDALAAVQDRLLASAARQLRRGGVLVYSTCTISPRENEERVDALVTAMPELEIDDLAAAHPHLAHPRAPRHLLVLPHRHGTDGFFIARLRRGK